MYHHQQAMAMAGYGTAQAGMVAGAGAGWKPTAGGGRKKGAGRKKKAPDAQEAAGAAKDFSAEAISKNFLAVSYHLLSCAASTFVNRFLSFR